MKIKKAEEAKHACVIGGGPAGLEAARILALRGHKVTLLEKENELGGLLKYASIPYFKVELRNFQQYLINQVKKLKIDILLGHCANLELVKGLNPDAVVVATGSTPRMPQIPGIQKSFVSNSLNLLSGKTKTGEKVLIVGGAAMGCEIAAHLASQNKKITIIEMLGELALDLEPRSRIALRSLLKEGGSKF